MTANALKEDKAGRRQPLGNGLNGYVWQVCKVHGCLFRPLFRHCNPLETPVEQFQIQAVVALYTHETPGAYTLGQPQAALPKCAYTGHPRRIA